MTYTGPERRHGAEPRAHGPDPLDPKTRVQRSRGHVRRVADVSHLTQWKRRRFNLPNLVYPAPPYTLPRATPYGPGVTFNTSTGLFEGTVFTTDYLRPSAHILSAPDTNSFTNALVGLSDDTLIQLTAGQKYNGVFKPAPRSGGSGYVYIEPAGLTGLPAEHTRVHNTDAPNMATIYAANLGECVNFATAGVATSRFRFTGLEFCINPAFYGGHYISLVNFGGGIVLLASFPHQVVFDRCYVHGDQGVGPVTSKNSCWQTRRGISMDGVAVAVLDSRITDIMDQPPNNNGNGSADAQALWSVNTPGPLKIINNELQASSEPVMFGGSGTSYGGNTQDVEIRQNHMGRPDAWKGFIYCKNDGENKQGQYVLWEGNIHEHQWDNSAAGFSDQNYAVSLKSVNQVGTDRQLHIADQTYWYNIIRNACGVMALSAAGDATANPSQFVNTPTNRISIRHNLIYNVNTSIYTSVNIVFIIADQQGQTIGGVPVVGTTPYWISDLDIQHNTIDNRMNTGPGGGQLIFTTFNPSHMVALGGPMTTALSRFTYANNLCWQAAAPITAGGGNVGKALLDACCRDAGTQLPDYVLRQNVMANAAGSAPAMLAGTNAMSAPYLGTQYPAGSVHDARFQDVTNHNYALVGNAATNPYIGSGTDGLDLGAATAITTARTAGVDL